mmetsp:Transcript_5995/g.10231  ORF Transcript_5995/g.10231 Transcript_5995/m.10231 type:complete len:380 (+) Transcript_5995:74-1213(+)
MRCVVPRQRGGGAWASSAEILLCPWLYATFGDLVHLDVPLAALLEAAEPRVVVDVLRLAHLGEHVLDARHHALEAAEIDVAALVEAVEDLVSVLLHLVLDVHLATLLVLHLAAERVVEAEVVRVLLLDRLELVIVEEGVRVGDAKEEPRKALVRLGSRSLLNKEALPERAVRRDAGAGGDHDDVGLRLVLRHEHDLARRAGHLHLGARLGVAEVVRAHTLLGRVLGAELRAPVGGAANAEGGGVAGHVVTVARRRDRVEADRVRLAVLRVGARRDHAERLALPVRHLALVVDDNVAGLAGGLRAHDALDRGDLAHERRLGLVSVHRDLRHVIVRRGLEEVLLGALGLHDGARHSAVVDRGEGRGRAEGESEDDSRELHG